ncbi:hypothetical protein LX36DRAFT_649313 [Colletotrichum falcatum]|nr:hypothetical protein LX36DRAFT_649313 [Colletotrichum falcatum]
MGRSGGNTQEKGRNEYPAPCASNTTRRRHSFVRSLVYYLVTNPSLTYLFLGVAADDATTN